MLCMPTSFDRRRAHAVAAFFGSASLIAMTSSAHAAVAPVAAPVEEVLITGTLIRGAEAVGVPVTALGQEQFLETGAMTVSDLLRAVPAVSVVVEGGSLLTGTGNFTKAAGVNIHDLNGSTPRTLVLFDGMRFPLQGLDNSQTDPSTVPQLAIQRVDVLADGASATYGSDAVAGVVNVILRRRFEGAITHGRVTHHPNMGLDWELSQLYGHRWATGDITATIEFYDRRNLLAKDRDFYTFDFSPWGLDDRTPVRSSIPSTIHFGGNNPSPSTGPFCDADVAPDIIPPNTTGAPDSVRCYSVPPGQNGTGLTWSQITPGVTNLVNPYFNVDLTPWAKRSALAVTFDQQLIEGVELFIDAFYSNRRGKGIVGGGFNTGVNNTFTAVVPTNNPFYPTGPLPAGATGPLRINYNISAEFPSLFATSVSSSHWAAGFNFDLPYEWLGKFTYGVNEEEGRAFQEQNPNLNHLSAALGNTVASVAGSGTSPGNAAFTKPANIPYFNPFCDSLAFDDCNDPATLEYIRGYRRDWAYWYQRIVRATADGPIFMLPGGEVRAAIGGGWHEDYFRFRRIVNYLQPRLDTPVDTPEVQTRDFYSAFAELNIPIVGEANALPMIQRLSVQASYRYDHYNDFGGTKNPRVAVDLEPIAGLLFRGSYGTSFRAPPFADTAEVQGRSYQQVNSPVGGSNSVTACTNSQLGSPAPSGTAAALLNPTCTSALQFQGGINAIGGVKIIENALDGLTRPEGFVLGPESARTYTLGAAYRPPYIPGLNIDVTYYNTRIEDLIDGGCTDLNDPTCLEFILVPGKTTPFTTPDGDNTVSQAEFDAAIAIIAPSAQSQIPGNLISNVRFLLDGSPRNAGVLNDRGIDFGAQYDWDSMWGVISAGLSGNYRLHRDTDGDDPFVGTNSNAGLGNSTASRMRARANLGWSDMGFRVTGFVNYISHSHHTQALPPACFIRNTATCPAPYVPPFPEYGNLTPAQYYIDLAVSYDTREDFANPYLHNIQFQINVNNLMNKYPPFGYRVSANGGSAGVVGGSPLGRAISFAISKNW
jgi:iron complex outermembrane receptor protein